jgi:hypothetical protein
MRAELEFAPQYTAEEALREFAGHHRASRYQPEPPDPSYDQERLRDTIERRSRTKDQQTTLSPDEE